MKHVCKWERIEPSILIYFSVIWARERQLWLNLFLRHISKFVPWWLSADHQEVIKTIIYGKKGGECEPRKWSSTSTYQREGVCLSSMQLYEIYCLPMEHDSQKEGWKTYKYLKKKVSYTHSWKEIYLFRKKVLANEWLKNNKLMYSGLSFTNTFTEIMSLEPPVSRGLRQVVCVLTSIACMRKWRLRQFKK